MGEAAATTSRNGVRAIVATVSKSRTESNGSFAYTAWFTACEPAYVTSIV
jgi:hypothetical protein